MSNYNSLGTVTMTLEHYEELKKKTETPVELVAFINKLTFAWKNFDKPNDYTDFASLEQVCQAARKVMGFQPL